MPKPKNSIVHTVGKRIPALLQTDQKRLCRNALKIDLKHNKLTVCL